MYLMKISTVLGPQVIEVFTYSHLHQQYGISPLHLIYILLKISLRTAANPSPKFWSFVQRSLPKLLYQWRFFHMVHT